MVRTGQCDGRRRNRAEAGVDPPLALHSHLPTRPPVPAPAARHPTRSKLGFALLAVAFLMLVFGFGISNDVNSLTFAVLDHDQSHECRAYLEELRGSAYFVEKPPLTDYSDLEKRLASGDIGAGIEIPPGFGRDIARGRSAWAAAWIDGARPFIAQTIRGYLEA